MFCMTLKNGFGKCSLFVLSANGWKDQNMDSPFSRQRKPLLEKALFDWPIELQYDVNRSIGWFLESSSGMKSFHPSVRSTNQKPRAFVTVR